MVRAHIQTDDDALADELSRLALLADVQVSRGRATGPVPEGVGLVLADPAAPARATADVQLLVITQEPASVSVLSAALDAGAGAVLTLPGDAQRLLDELVVRTRRGSPGRVVGVVGGAGGVGASSFAAACAQACAPSLLLDCDLAGGGLDVLLGLEQESGPRWSDLARAGGAGSQRGVSGAALRAALPRLGDVAVLSHDGVAVSGAALAAVLHAGREDGGHVVLDLPRHGAALLLEGARARLDELLIVLPDDVHGVIAAGRVAAAVSPFAARMRLVLLRAGGGVPSELVAQSLGLEVAGRLALGGRHATGGPPSRAWVRVAREVVL